VFHQIDDLEHPLLYLPGTDLASNETAISGSFQQNLAGICYSVCDWWQTDLLKAPEQLLAICNIHFIDGTHMKSLVTKFKSKQVRAE
jgi:hypothetical protein